MKIAIIGTRGIPNFHGGFEQFAEYFSVYMAQKGHSVYVYNSHSHPYKEKIYNNVKIIHCNDPEEKIGAIGQFIYDFNCILDARKKNFDLILQLGYTSNSIWHWLLPKKAVIVTNMDGLEWKRSKYSKPVQRFLKFAEKLAINSSDHLISDSLGIKNYIKKTYNLNSKYIAYGATPFLEPDVTVLNKYNIKPDSYNMLIARLEPENNVEVILDGVASSESSAKFLVVGKYNSSKFGKYLKNKYHNYKNIEFLGGVYDISILNNLRYYSNIYFHGHSVGGTNPSLLEAMASNTLIVANDNIFNRSILKENAFYFNTAKDVSSYVDSYKKKEHLHMVNNSFKDVKKTFNWNIINQEYTDYLEECLAKNNTI